MASSTIIPMPANERDFEEFCVPLFAGHLNDPNVKTVGARGFAQKGVDLLGARDRDPDQPVGIQCKLRTKGDRLTESQVRDEVTKALKIEPELTEYYIITTAPDDPMMDFLAMKLRQEQSKLGRKIDIQVWGWETAQRNIRLYRKAMEAFDPGHSAASEALLDLGAETNALVREQGSIIVAGLDELRTTVRAIPSDPARGSLLEVHLDDQVDQYRDLINAGQPQTALKLLLQLENKLGVDASAAIRARVRANIGWCQLRLGEDEAGGRLFLEAYVLNPADPKVIANRVLGLILTGQPAEALAVGRAALADDPTNAGVASFIYQAAAALDDETDPDGIVPEPLREDVNVAVHRISWLRARSGDIRWRRLAASVHERFPEDDAVAQLVAEAMLDEAFASNAFERNRTPTQKQEDLLHRASAILAARWEKARRAENADQEYLITIAVNLANAYRAQMQGAKAKAVIEQAIAIAPANVDALGTAMLIALEEDDPASALGFARRLPEGPLRTVQLLNVLARQEDWITLVAEGTPGRAAQLDADDRQAFDTLMFRARLNSGLEPDVRKAAEALVDAWPQSIATLVVVSDALRGVDADRADALFAKAAGLLDETTPYGDRLMLAQLAGLRNDFDDVIRCLDGYVRMDLPSYPLVSLALAFANADTRPRTHEFFEGLAPSVIENPRYARLAGVAEANRGDLPLAEKHLRLAASKDPTDLRAHLHLYSVLRRQDQNDAACDHLKSVDEHHQDGAPRDLMRLAQILTQIGELERGLALGYRLARGNPRDEVISAAYPPMILTAGDLPEPILRERAILEDFWFALQGEDGVEDVQGVIETDPACDDSYPPGHPLAAAVLGRAVGDTVVLRREFGPSQTFKVKELRHRYLWLMRDIMKRHATAFPESNSLISMHVEDGDIQPILDMVKQLTAQQQRVADTYANNPLPLSVIAALSGKSVIELAEQLVSVGGLIRACDGNLPERELALKQIRAARGKGAVLDALTVWVARQLKILPSLKAYFGRLIVPRSTIDMLLELRATRAFHRGQDYMTVGYQGEQAVRDVRSPEDTEAVLTLIDATIADIERDCEIKPNDGADDIGLDPDILARLAEGDVLDPIHLVRRENLFLLSEDLHLRQWAGAYGAKRGAWLQPVIRILTDSGLLQEEDYVLAIGQLAARRHGHIWLDAGTFRTIRALKDEPKRDAIFKVMLGFIGGPNAHLPSHIAVVADFMQEVERGNIAGPRPGEAVSALIAQLIKGQGLWPAILLRLHRELGQRVSALDVSGLYARRYLGRWFNGHFLHAASKEPRQGTARPPRTPSNPPLKQRRRRASRKKRR